MAKEKDQTYERGYLKYGPVNVHVSRSGLPGKNYLRADPNNRQLGVHAEKELTGEMIGK